MFKSARPLFATSVCIPTLCCDSGEVTFAHLMRLSNRKCSRQPLDTRDASHPPGMPVSTRLLFLCSVVLGTWLTAQQGQPSTADVQRRENPLFDEATAGLTCSVKEALAGALLGPACPAVCDAPGC